MSRSHHFDFIMLIYFIDDAIYIYVVWSTWTYARKIIRELYRSINGSFFFWIDLDLERNHEKFSTILIFSLWIVIFVDNFFLFFFTLK